MTFRLKYTWLDILAVIAAIAVAAIAFLSIPNAEETMTVVARCFLGFLALNTILDSVWKTLVITDSQVIYRRGIFPKKRADLSDITKISFPTKKKWDEYIRIDYGKEYIICPCPLDRDSFLKAIITIAPNINVEK